MRRWGDGEAGEEKNKKNEIAPSDTEAFFAS
jgi:hypothetical protein